MARRGYTLVEMMISIGILTLLLGVVGFNYNSSKNFETMKLEIQRLASAIRSARSRDFNSTAKLACYDDISAGSVVHACNKSSDCTTGSCTMNYPYYGYGVHIEQVYKVCSGDTTRSCYDNLDCTGAQGTCTTNNPQGRSSYVVFADFTNPTNPHFNGGKTGGEFVEEFIMPKDFRPYFFKTTNGCNDWDAAEVLFDSGALSLKDRVSNSWSSVAISNDDGSSKANQIGLILELWYAPGGTRTDSVQTRRQHGRITIDQPTLSTDDKLMSNTTPAPSFVTCG